MNLILELSRFTVRIKQGFVCSRFVRKSDDSIVQNQAELLRKKPESRCDVMEAMQMPWLAAAEDHCMKEDLMVDLRQGSRGSTREGGYNIAKTNGF